ncbi:manganese catalase family protein [Cytobacillus gottheilii]|uniref:Manganese catalase family protein n=1 Tax=Cytobacillus gottheilii TaxID=859144 RepID=A0ABX8F9R1_9BACI|nr:manganese catalase family protein [Cytobacillus gottheilii]QVY61066.1 manganese catalase family protein [Cytobacillus gottheilii]
MFYHIKELQYNAKPERPDPVYAKKLQEILGGQYGEMSVMVQYLFQGWNCRAEKKYRDMLLDIGTEEIAHVEMLATMIAQLLDGAPVKEQEAAAKDPIIHAAMGGMNPQHVIVGGLGAKPDDSTGYPWNSRYTIASGNLLADFRANLNAESQGRLQAVRLYEMTDDPGVRDMLSFMIARDTMHQNQWLAAIAEIEQKEGLVVPATFNRENEKQEVSYSFMNYSKGTESAAGRWASGASMDGKGQFEYIENPEAMGQIPNLAPAPVYVHGTLPGSPPPMQ